MLMLGVLSIIQVVFLPGFLVLKSLRMTGGLFRTSILSFSLSLIINHFLVLALVILRIYSSITLYSIFFAEILLLVWLTRPILKKPIITLLDGDEQRISDFFASIKTCSSSAILIKVTFFLIASITLLFFVTQTGKNLGQVFNAWDDIVSWNRWAVDWYKGHLPTLTYHYPQLLPINWSMTYIFLGDSTVQFFAKAIMPFFSLAILLSLLDLGFRSKQVGYMAAISITGVLLIFVVGVEGLSHGYADIPVAFMGFVPIYLLLLSEGADSITTIKENLFVGAFCCAGAALTKQAGLYLLLIYPLVCYATVLRTTAVLNKRERIRIIVTMYIIMLIIVAPWYSYTELRILNKLETSEISYVMDAIHKGKSMIVRFLTAIHLIKERLSIQLPNARILPVLLYIGGFSSFLLSMLNRTWRYLSLLVIIPFFFIWAAYFSYDLRNIALVVPLIGTAIGIGTQYSGDAFRWGARILQKVRISVVMVLMIVLAVAATSKFDKAKLVERQLSLQKKIGSPIFNDILYQYNQKYGLKGKVITNYQLMKYLPGLEQFFKLDYMGDLQTLKNNLRDTDAQYLFCIPMQELSKDVKEYMDEEVRTQKLELLSATEGVVFVKIKRDFP